jgi:hypothetical protein
MRAFIGDLAKDLGGMIEEIGRSMAAQVDQFCFQEGCALAPSTPRSSGEACRSSHR